LQINLQPTKNQLYVKFTQTLPHNILYYEEALGVTVSTEDDKHEVFSGSSKLRDEDTAGEGQTSEMSSQRKFKVHIRGVTAETEHRLHRSC
jgi:hypothetical protein